MSLHDDPDLETRLRRIAAGPEPEVPASIYRQLNEVAAGNRARSINGVRLERVRRAGGNHFGLRLAGAGALAAVLVIAVTATGFLVTTRGPQPAATWTVRPDAGQGEWTGLEWHDITATAGGIGSDGQSSMMWRSNTTVVAWRGGFATVGGDMNVWVSAGRPDVDGVLGCPSIRRAGGHRRRSPGLGSDRQRARLRALAHGGCRHVDASRDSVRGCVSLGVCVRRFRRRRGDDRT